MAFQKGRVKTGGRSKGVKNIVPTNLKDMMQSFLTENQAEFQKAWMKLSDEEKVRTYLKTAEFVIPKAKSETGNNFDPNDVGFTVQIR